MIGSTVKRVYILGLGHTGTTLLDMILGSHTHMFSLGEMHVFDDWLRDNNICTCGKSITNCGFWSQVLQKYQKDSYIPSEIVDMHPTQLYWQHNYRIDRYRHLLSIACVKYLPSKLCLSAIRALAPELYVRTNNANDLLDAAEFICGKRILIDSSKDAMRMKLIYCLRPSNTKIIFLTRDARGWLASRIRQTGESPDIAAKRWINYHHQFLRVLKTIPTSSYRHVHYEAISRQPNETIEKICHFLNVPFEDQMLSYRDEIHHNICGNPMRMGNERRIIEDLRWRSFLTPSALISYERIAGNLNRRLLGKFYNS
jgi:hypothetical protein